MFLVVGLGNPDKKYFKNYHNTGFMVLKMLTDSLDIKFKKKECSAVIAEYYNNDKIIFALPQTYMNLSGISVLKFINKYKIPLENILIVYDDIDILPGEIRFKQQGSGGTHNGMKNIIETLKSEDICRLRIGIGKPKNPNIPLADYVLSDIPKNEMEIFNDTFEKAGKAVMDFVSGKTIIEIMQKYN